MWREVLGTSCVGLDDHWVALGGDSRGAIHAVRRLGEHGVPVTPMQLLAAGTVRALAEQVPGFVQGSQQPRRPGETAIVTTPAQEWFWEQNFADPAQLTRGRLLAVETTTKDLQAVVTKVFGRHEAFRTRFRRGPGGWEGYLLPELPPVDVAELAVNPPADGLAPDVPPLFRLLREHKGLSITDGPLWRVVTFLDYVRGLRWLYVVIHWLIGDELSLEVITRDLAAELLQPGALPDTAAALTTAPTVPATENLAVWRRLATRRLPLLAPDTAGEGRAPYGEWIHDDVTLSASATRAVEDLTRRLTTVSVQDILVAGVYRALTPITKGDGLHVSLSVDGRGNRPDAGELVGALASHYPALLTDTTAGDIPLTAPPTARARPSLVTVAQCFHEQLAQLPQDRSAYATARYLVPDRQLAGVPAPLVSVSYLGRRTLLDGPLRVLPVPTELVIGAANVQPTILNITAEIVDRTLRITLASDPHRLNQTELTSIRTRLLAELELLACLQPIAASPEISARRVFAVHPVDGGNHWYRELADALASRADCYGLRAQAAPDALREDDLPSVAHRYVQYLRTIQPDGPYVLVGWDTAAGMAYAMARWLEAAGQEVQLVLIDPRPCRWFGSGTIDPAALAINLCSLADLPPRDAYALANEALTGSVQSQATVLVDRIASGDTDLADQLSVLLHTHNLLARWRPKGSVENLTVVHSDHAADREAADEWRQLGQSARAVAVPRDRRTILTDPVALAAIVDMLVGPVPSRDNPLDSAAPE